MAASSSAVALGTVREAPVRASSSPVEGAQVGLRVADVDREQHRPDYPGRNRMRPHGGGEALRDPRLASVARPRADAGAQGHPVQARRPDAGDLQGRPAGAALPRETPSRRSSSTGRRIQGSREIARELDRIQPEPPLFPADPEQRAKVEEAEAWGDEFQQKPRRFVWWAFRRDRAPMASYSEGARLGRAGRPGRQDGRSDRGRRGPAATGPTDANVRADLAALPATSTGSTPGSRTG